MNSKDYVFYQIPAPIAHCKDLTFRDKYLWSVIHTWDEMKRNNLSIKKLAEVSGIDDRRNVNRILDKLEDLGLVERRRKRRRGMHLVDVKPLWPEWLDDPSNEKFLTEKARDRTADDRVQTLDESKCTEGGASNQRRGVRQNDAPQEDEGGASKQHRGGASKQHRGVRQTDTPNKRSLRVEDKSSMLARGESPRAKVNEEKSDTHPGRGKKVYELEESGDEELGDEEIEDTHDKDSPEGLKRAAEKIAEREARSSGRRVKQLRPPSGPELAETPSKRWELSAHASRLVKMWSGMDLVGYWVTKYLAAFGEEDENFYAAGVKNRAIAASAKNAASFTNRHLKGDRARARDAIDAILERAEARGQPVSFNYFFTPSNPQTLLDILDRRGRNAGGRRETLREVNDRAGTRENWERVIAERERRRNEGRS